MSNPFVAEIRIFPFNFAPQGWAMCNGQLLPISQNTALFSLLGTFYGGDGKSNFALPNLQGSAPLAAGQGPALSLRDVGELGGEPTVILINTEMPSHTHTMECVSAGGGTNSPTNAFWAGGGRGSPPMYAPLPGQPVQMNPAAMSITGNSSPHNNMPPYLGLNFCIAMQGVFPPRG